MAGAERRCARGDRGPLIAHTRGEPLSAVATLRTQRTGRVAQRHGHDIAEVVEDHVDVLDDDRVISSFEELEIESMDGNMKSLRRLEKNLRRAGAVDPNGRPKLFQALDLPRVPGPRKARSPQECLAADLQKQYRRMLDHEPGARLGHDPEEVHDYRVAVRRMRATLRAGRPLFDRAWADDLRGSLKRVGAYLGDVRDLDVQIERFRDQGGIDEVIELRHRRAHAQSHLVRELSEPWFLVLLERLDAAVAHPEFAGHGSLRKQVRREHRRVRRKVGRLGKHPADRELHEVRKAVKRARYAAEVAAACNSRGLERYIKRAKQLQDTLGDHQDAVVSIQLLRGFGDPPGLVKQNRAEQRAVRKHFPRAWKRLDKHRPR